MKAWLIDGMNGMGALRLSEAPDPKAGKGEVVLDVRFAALNPADRYLAEGQYPGKPSMPHILGRDGVGVVSAVGPGVDQIQIGDKRMVLRSEIGVSRAGTFAERVAVPVESLVEVVGRAGGGGAAGLPDGVSGAHAMGRSAAGRITRHRRVRRGGRRQRATRAGDRPHDRRALARCAETRRAETTRR